MRWERLFDDLQAQLDQAERDGDAALDAELIRAEVATIALSGRLAAHLGRPLTLRCGDGAPLRGDLVDAGPEWVLLGDGPRRTLVPAAAIVAVTGLGREVAPDPGVVGSRLGLGHALRALARDRAAVRVAVAGGTTLDGTVDRICADHLDLAEHPGGEARRRQAVRTVWSIPFSALRAIHSENS